MTSSFSSFEKLLTEERVRRVVQVAEGRTRGTVLVLEACHDPHNTAAVIRTAEALGILEVHIVEHPSLSFAAHKKISVRAEKWLELVRHESTAAAIAHLKARGYRVLAAHPDAGEVTLYDIDFRRRTALIFGNEHAGVSVEALARVDGAFAIPTRGFTRSLNLSVAAAVCLAHATFFRAALGGGEGDLSAAEREALAARYARTAYKHHRRLERALKNAAAPVVSPGKETP